MRKSFAAHNAQRGQVRAFCLCYDQRFRLVSTPDVTHRAFFIPVWTLQGTPCWRAQMQKIGAQIASVCKVLLFSSKKRCFVLVW